MGRKKKHQPIPSHAICGHPTKKGDICQRKAGFGTEHPKVGACNLHDDSWRSERLAQQNALSYAKPSLAYLTGKYESKITPQEALLLCIKISAGEVAYFSEKIEELGEDEVLQRYENGKTWHVSGGAEYLDLEEEVSVVESKDKVELNIWLQARKESLNNLARYSKMALDAGVEERLVQVAESNAHQLAKLINGVLADLELNDSQLEKMPNIVRKHLLLL